MGGLPGPLGTPSAPTESESSPLDREPRGRWAGLCHSPRVCWTLTGSCLWNQKRKPCPPGWGSPRGLLGVTADVTVTQTVLLGAEACVLPRTYRKLNPCDKKWLFYLFFMEESHPCVIVNSTDGKQSSCFTKRNRVF